MQALVQADLTEKIYVKLPPGCRDLTGNIMRLKESFYGLRQSAFELNRLLSGKRVGPGFDQSAVDRWVFRLVSGEDQNVEILLLAMWMI